MDTTMQVMFSRKSDDWATPVEAYRTLDAEFHFTDDPCPIGATDGLERSWKGSVFVNPPYSNIVGFMEKAMVELASGNATTVVFLVPSRTDTKWFHRFVLGMGGGTSVHQGTSTIWRQQEHRAVSQHDRNLQEAFA